MSLLRILIVDDHDAVRRGIRALLAPRTDWTVCGEAADGFDGFEKARTLQPDVVLMDLSLPRMSGVEATRLIRKQVPAADIILISQSDLNGEAKQMAEIGARCYISKSELSRELVAAIEKIARERAFQGRAQGDAATAPGQNVSFEESEADFRTLADTATIGVHIVGPDGIVLWANQANLDMLDYERQEYFGHHISEFHVDPPVVEDMLARLNRGEMLRDTEVRLRSKTGRIRHVLVSSTPLFQDGRFLHTRCFSVDITERKEAETQILESERRFREMIDALPAAIYTTDAEGRLTHFNPAAVRFSGRVPTLGTDHWCVSWKMYLPDGTPLPHEECPMAVALKEGRVIDGVEAIAERPDGSRVWFTPFPRPLHDAQGRIIGGINMLLDITERKQAERASGLLAAIVDSSEDAVISKNLDGIITSWNKSAERLFGYTAEEAVGLHITLIIPQDRRQEETAILAKLKRGERVEHFETVRMRRDGTTFDISLTISPVRDAAGRIIGASKVARNITAQKHAERALRESEERLRELAESLETQVRLRTEQLERRNAEVLLQSDQLRDLSTRLLQTQDDERRRIARELHDSAGQLLTALGMNFANIRRQAGPDSPLGDAVRDSEELVQQLSNEIRTMSYLLHPPLLDETGLSAAIHWYVQGLTQRSGLQIELHIPENFGRLPGAIEMALFRIVQEGLTNIHRHSGSRTAAIRLARSAGSVSLEIQDEGQGMSVEKLNGIRGRSSGVGITGMRERVRHLKGEMNIESSGDGTRISVTFPVAAAPAPSAEAGDKRRRVRAAS